MNKKLALLIGILAFFAMNVTAQDYKYGVYVGIGFNNMKISNDMYYDDSQPFTTMTISGIDTTYSVKYTPIDEVKVDPSTSFSFGGFYEMPVSEKLGLQLHLLYNQYGYTMTGKVDQPVTGTEFSEEYDYKGTLKISNLSASVLLKYYIPTYSLSIEAGVTPSYCIRMTKDVERGVLHKSLNYKKDEYNPLNVCGTIGATYYFLDNFMLSLKANLGLLNVLKVKNPYYPLDEQGHEQDIQYTYSDTKSTTNSVYITVGYRF